MTVLSFFVLTFIPMPNKQVVKPVLLVSTFGCRDRNAGKNKYEKYRIDFILSFL